MRVVSYVLCSSADEGFCLSVSAGNDGGRYFEGSKSGGGSEAFVTTELRSDAVVQTDEFEDRL